MKNSELIHILEEIALILDLKGENPFKSKAYISAANHLKENEIDIEKEVRDGTLKSIKGFGDALTAKITDFCQNGKMQYYEDLKSNFPIGLLDIVKISGIGVSKAKLLYNQASIDSIEKLEQACLNNQIKDVKGFSASSAKSILNSISLFNSSKGKFNLEQAQQQLDIILEKLQTVKSILQIEPAGRLVQGYESISELVIIISAEDINNASKETSKLFKTKIISNGEISFVTDYNLRIIMIFCLPEEFALCLHKFSASEDYLISFADLIKDKGFSILNNRLLNNIGNEVSIEKEKDIYKAVGINYIVPELRDNSNIIEESISNKPPILIEYKDLKGILHIHSTWSDGDNSIEEMAIEAEKQGFEYIAVCDHSRSAFYANGLSEERIELQHQEIDKLNNSGLKIKILKGIESDILKNGDLDYPADVLSSFDLVVASIHSYFNLSDEEMTQRIIKALENPYMSILGHPTGALIHTRNAYKCNIEMIIDAAAQNKKIIEINSAPQRLDLSWQNIRKTRDKGIMFAINPDSHNCNTYGYMHYGIKTARKGMLSSDDVVNTKDFNSFTSYIKGMK